MIILFSDLAKEFVIIGRFNRPSGLLSHDDVFVFTQLLDFSNPLGCELLMTIANL